MKKIIKSLSILMMTTMIILPTAVSTQAEEIEDITIGQETAVTQSIPSGFTKKATINANNVNLRNGSWVSLGQLHKGDTIYLDNTGVHVINGYPSKRCYSVRHELIGYVYINYIDE